MRDLVGHLGNKITISWSKQITDEKRKNCQKLISTALDWRNFENLKLLKNLWISKTK